jgi:L-cysteate sulfo-lyase
MTGVPVNDRYPLIAGETPLEPLERLTAYLGGPRIFVKRDDNTGFGLGGNKVRKLEYLAAAAVAQGCDTLLTIGGTQSNHCRQTAAVAARLGMGCELILADGAFMQDHAFAQSGNVLLDRLFGATLHSIAADADRHAALAVRAEAIAASGRRPYVIPSGGSSAVGALGYVRAAEELIGQVARLGLGTPLVVQTTGSGGTQAGLQLGLAAAGSDMRVVAFSCGGPSSELTPKVRGLLRDTAPLVQPTVNPEAIDVVIRDEQVGEGYGLPTDAGLDAIRLLARLEGILLDPVYTSKSMAGLIALARSGEIARDAAVVFLHTGGSPALFAYESRLGVSSSTGTL